MISEQEKYDFLTRITKDINVLSPQHTTICNYLKRLYDNKIIDYKQYDFALSKLISNRTQ